jgi:Mg-chelatase subunit ChlD
MRIYPLLAGIVAVAWLGPGLARLQAAEEDGVALAIIYDTSGSMSEPVRDSKGQPAPKYVIANRALSAIARQIAAFATNAATGTPRKIQTGLFVFDGETAREAIKFGPFDAAAIQNWASHFSSPSGGTPLGNALSVAGRAVLESPLSRKHVLIITDGLNTLGQPPAVTLPPLNRQAEQQHARLSVHFIAFDVAASQFNTVKKLGATVVGASDEKQLNSQLDFILQRKILLEEEETK